MVLDMLSRPTIVMATTACLFLTSCASVEDREIASPVFHRGTPKSRFVVTGDVAALCKNILGYNYPSGEIIYRTMAGSTEWVLVTQGRHALITSRFVISDGQITSSEVLSSKEQRGRQITSKRFLRQFRGQYLSKEQLLSKRVDAITGATISSRAMTDAALLALSLQAFVDRVSRE